jgi:glucans biosynthesis protein C
MTNSSALSEIKTISVQTAAKAKSAVRLNYLDSLRAILITLVIALHTAIAYGAIGSWTFMDPANNEASGIPLTLITGLVQAFSLGLYFFISGTFIPGSYDRKGGWQFWKDKLLRLGIPLILYTFALSRIPTYVAQRATGDVTESFFKFFGRTFLSQADEGPTWFIFSLLVFIAVYTIWRHATSAVNQEKLAWINRVPVPGKRKIIIFGLIVSVLMFLVGLKSKVGETVNVFGIFSLMTIFFVQYILFFVAGLFASRNNWLIKFNGQDLRFWSWLSLGLGLMLPVVFGLGIITGGSPDAFSGGFSWQSAAFMLWVGLFSVSISMTLILWMRDRKQPQSRLMAFAGANSYGVYLIHPLVLVPITVAMVPLAIHSLLKFVIVLPVVVFLCFLVSAGLRRIPGVKRIL